jgi:hypothetical protein
MAKDEMMDFDFSKVFSDQERKKQPTTYDKFPAPETQPSELRVRLTADILIAYRDHIKDPSLSAEVREEIDTELGVFMRWINLNDDEYEKAQEIADKALETEGEQ